MKGLKGTMTSDTKRPHLSSLLGEQLSAVTFVQDYLQIDFDGKRFTIHEWPSINSEGGTLEFGDPGYRDGLCSLIGKLVARAGSAEKAIVIAFADGSSLRIRLSDSRVQSGDRAIFHDENDGSWSWW